MTDYATPNLPSNDLDKTAAFYEALGFQTGFKDDGWMIMKRGTITLEFVPLEVDPKTTAASCCLRVDDLDALHADFAKVGLADNCWATPRLTSPVDQPWGMRDFALVDPDGNLLRCIQN